MSTKTSSRAWSSAIVAGWGWARSQALRVCWKRSTLPQVVGWLGRGVLLGDAKADQGGFEGVTATAATGQAGGEDHAVVGQRRRWWAVALDGGQEGVDHDRAADPDMSGDRQGVAGVVVEPGQDLAVPAGGEGIVGEVGLPGLVGLVGLEADIGGARALLGLGGDQPGAAQVAVDRGRSYP